MPQLPQTRVVRCLQALAEPGEFLLSDFSKLDRSAQLHLGFQSLDAFQVSMVPLTFQRSITTVSRSQAVNAYCSPAAL